MINLLVFLISRDLSFELIRVVTQTQLNNRVTTLSSGLV